ncbi:DNA polymerase III subunit epsilon [Anaerobacillus alkalilacustris]|uniref:DNA polymerase III subunit epsilon n=1 Tax=Anaerobacillus alkalilacustris TaxID=393763 RepID=A0A1S2LWU0_9BACI|nr:exonuclease domain-containing protein [Anaerobacillus alkalilacustris]OIJ16794.1 DNA polymerase III subunit epsilon [Anaerobacillus alkalilacustris]
MNMNQMFQYLKQLSGKVSPNMYASVMNQNTASNIAFVRQLQRDLKKQDILEVPFSELKLVVFDLETTGFFPNKGDQIVSIGAVKMEGEKVLEDETFYSLIHNTVGLSNEIEQLTGITKDELLKAPPVETVLSNFYQFIKSAPLVAHHASHEKSFMQHVTWTVLKTRFEHRVIDTSFLTKIVEPKTNLVSLDDCCKHFGIKIERRHHALHDAVGTAKLWSETVREIQGLGFQHLKDVYSYLATLK